MPKNRLNLLFLAASLASLATSSAQQWEASVGFAASEDDALDHAFDASLDRYFAPLDSNSRYPQQEIAFGERISSAGLSLAYQNGDAGNDAYESRLKVEALSLRFNRRAASSNHAWSIGVAIGEQDGLTRSTRIADSVLAYSSAERAESLGARIAYEYYVDHAWTVGAFLARSANERLSEIRLRSQLTPVEFETEEVAYQIGITIRRLWELSSGQWALLTAQVDYRESDSESRADLPPFDFIPTYHSWNFAVGGAYFLDRRTSVSLDVHYDDAHSKATRLSLGFTRFVTDLIFFELELSREEIDTQFDAFGDDDTLSGGGRVGFRF